MDAEHSGPGRLRRWARGLKAELGALALATRDPRMPWYARVVAVAVVAYAASPIDLIPDFIPVLGYLDDIVIVPAGIWLVRRLVPPEVLAECRARARAAPVARGHGRAAAVAIVATWIAAAVLAGWWVRTATGPWT